jgi:hypothetical protein
MSPQWENQNESAEWDRDKGYICSQMPGELWALERFDTPCYFYPGRDCPGYLLGGLCGRIGQRIPREKNTAYSEANTKGKAVKKFMLNLKRQAEENPMVAIGVGTAAVAVATKLVEAAVSTRNSQTWKQEVNRRNRNS